MVPVHFTLGCFAMMHTLMGRSEVKVTQSCPILWDSMDYTVHGILQARILEWAAFPFSRGSSQPSDQTQMSRIAGKFFTSWATREVPWNQRAWLHPILDSSLTSAMAQFCFVFIFFLIYFLTEGWSLYRTVLVSAKPQHESAWLSLLTAFSLGPSPRTTDWFIRSRIGPSCATSSTALRRIQWDKHIQKHSVMWCPSFCPEMISASQLLNVSDQSQTARKHKVDYISDIIKLRTALFFCNQYLMSSKLTWLKVNKQKLLIFSFVSCLLIV